MCHTNAKKDTSYIFVKSTSIFWESLTLMKLENWITLVFHCNYIYGVTIQCSYKVIQCVAKYEFFTPIFSGMFLDVLNL